MYARRQLLRLGAASVAAGMAASVPAKGWSQDLIGDLLTSIDSPSGYGSAETRALAFHNLHTDEKLEAIYFDRGVYVPDALAAVNHVLRDFRTGDVHMIDPRLLDLLHTVQGTVESRKPFQIISGYRSPTTNAMLHETTPGVANNSFHMKGMASDIRLPDVQLAHLHGAALSLGRGGVGYYPASDFVHVDVGPVRSWG